MSLSLLHRSGHKVHSALVLLSAILPLSMPHSHPKLQSSPFQLTLSLKRGPQEKSGRCSVSLWNWLVNHWAVWFVVGSIPEMGQGKKPPVTGPCLRPQQFWSPHAGGKGSHGLQARRNPAIYNHLPKSTAPGTYNPESNPAVMLHDLCISQPGVGSWEDSGSSTLKDIDKDIPGNRKHSVLFPTCNCKPVSSMILYMVLGSVN